MNEKKQFEYIMEGYVWLSFSEGHFYPGVVPGVFLRGITPNGCDTRVKNIYFRKKKQ